MIDKLVNICLNEDCILKITYHRCIGWDIRIHMNGHNIPMVNIINEDRNIALNNAYEEILKKL